MPPKRSNVTNLEFEISIGPTGISKKEIPSDPRKIIK